MVFLIKLQWLFLGLLLYMVLQQSEMYNTSGCVDINIVACTDRGREGVRRRGTIEGKVNERRGKIEIKKNRSRAGRGEIKTKQRKG